METNEYQIGGDHYKGEYQHWDFVHDVQMPYHLGCATKYLSRWRKKNGLQDLQKATHYIAKAEDLGIEYTRCRCNDEDNDHMVKFIHRNFKVGDPTVKAFIATCQGDYSEARRVIQELVDEETFQQEIATARGRDGV